MIVDDERISVELTRALLGQLGYEVVGFARSQDALEALRAAPGDFDLIVTDQSMPGMSGTELARLAMQIRADLPVVIATGYVRARDVARARELGISEIVVKPTSIEEWCILLQSVLPEPS